jgi:hypothetical protein
MSLNLPTDLYDFKVEDALARRIMAEGRGWSTWADENTIYFQN